MLVEGGTDTFATNVKVAPGETNTWQFSVRNYEGALVSETAMNLAFAVDVQATEGKAAIAPLTVTVTNEAGDVLGEASQAPHDFSATSSRADGARPGNVYTATARSGRHRLRRQATARQFRPVTGTQVKEHE